MFHVIYRDDSGFFVIESFDEKGRPLGLPVQASGPVEAFKVWAMLCGYGDIEDTLPVGFENELFVNQRKAA